MSAERLTPEERARRETWLQELGEASVLPPSDPRRASVEAEVERRGGWAHAHWQALQAEGAAWRKALVAVQPPEDLTRRLRAIPAQNVPARGSRPRFSRRTLLWPAAALVLLALGVFLSTRDRGDVEDAVREVALLALNDHLDTHEQDVLADDPAVLARDLQVHIPFPVELPDLDDAARPVGGRKCTLGSHPVAFTAWEGRGGRLTLLQLRRSDFGLPADMAPRVVRPDGEAARGRPLDVLFFGRGDVVWVAVADDRDDLRRVRDTLGSP